MSNIHSRTPLRQILVVSAVGVLFALQLAARAPAPLHVGPMPPAPPPNWTGIIGEYGTEQDKIYLFEKDGSLHLLHAGTDLTLTQSGRNRFSSAQTRVVLNRSKNGEATRLKVGQSTYPRLPIPSRVACSTSRLSGRSVSGGYRWGAERKRVLIDAERAGKFAALSAPRSS